MDEDIRLGMIHSRILIELNRECRMRNESNCNSKLNRLKISKVKCDACRLWICPNCISMELYDSYKEFKCQKVRFNQMFINLICDIHT